MAMKIDLEDWFDYVILMRGKEYFLDDRVIDLKKTGLRYKAKVYGSRLYNVNIIVDKYGIVNSYFNIYYLNMLNKRQLSIPYVIIN